MWSHPGGTASTWRWTARDSTGRPPSPAPTTRSSRRRAPPTSTGHGTGSSSASSSRSPALRTRAPRRASRSPRLRTASSRVRVPCARSAVTCSTRTRRSCARRLADTGDALRAGFPEKAAESAATARGYWWILRDAFVGQRGAPAGDAARSRLRAPRRRRPDRQQPAATAAATATIGDDLLAFRAAPLSASEQARRAGQLIRYLGLVPVEYGRGVANGNVIVPIEIQEAIAFRDGAAIAFGDLQSYLAARDLAGDPRGAAALGAARRPRLGDADARHRGRRSRRASRRSRQTATSAARRRLPGRLEGRHGRGRLRRHRDAPDRRSPPLAAAGDLRRAESSRLEAYATFELGPEQRLRGLAPSLFQRVEGLFWYGADGHDGLAQLLRQNATRGRARRDHGRARRSRSRSPPRRSGAARSPAPRSSRTARSSSSAKGSRRCSSSPR